MIPLTVGERIKQVRMENKMSQAKFGERIKIAGQSVSLLEIGKNNASDQTISLICKEFGVSETWLRTGEGEMMVPRTDDEKITELLDDVLASKPDVRRRLISALARLDPEDWDLIEKMIDPDGLFDEVPYLTEGR